MIIVYWRAAAAANQIWWLITNPYSGSLPQPNG
jgi:hypothetical protein